MIACSHGVEISPEFECWKCDRVWRDLQFSPEHLVLANFYAVDSMLDLVDAQHRHIEKLQAKLPFHNRNDQPRRVREG